MYIFVAHISERNRRGRIGGFHILIGILIGVFDGGFLFEFKSVIMNNVLKSNHLTLMGF